MPNIYVGSIDVSPVLAWSEVSASGLMVMGTNGPIVTGNQWATLNVLEDELPRPEGILRRFTFDSIIPISPDIAGPDRTTFRDQVAAIIALFPTHTFGGVNRVIRFRGDTLDDNWRVGLVGGVVKMQTATLTWVDVP